MSTAVTQSPGSSHAHVHDGTGKALALFGCIMGALGFGGVIIASIWAPALIESKAKSESAYARETAQTADREARVALEQVDRIRDEVHDKLGIKIPVKTALKGEQK